MDLTRVFLDNGNDDEAYERAIQESMKNYGKMEEEEGKEEEENKFKAFQGTGVSLASTIHHSDLESYFEKWNSADDPELAFAMKLSIAV